MYGSPYSSLRNPTGDRFRNPGVEIPVYITDNSNPERFLDTAKQYGQLADSQQWATPRIHVSGFEPAAALDRGYTFNEGDQPFAQQMEMGSFGRQQPGSFRSNHPAIIPIKRDKSFSATNLSDSDLRFPENQPSFRWSTRQPASHMDKGNHVSQSRYSEMPSSHVYQHPEPERYNFHEMSSPFWNRSFPYGNEPFQHPPYPHSNYNHDLNVPTTSSFSRDFRTHPIPDFESFDPFAQIYPDGSAAGYRVPFDDATHWNQRYPNRQQEFTRFEPHPSSSTNGKMRPEEENPRLQPSRHFRRRDSSEPPPWSCKKDTDNINSRLAFLESELEQIVSESKPNGQKAGKGALNPEQTDNVRTFAGRVKPELIKYINFLDSQIPKIDEATKSLQINVRRRTEELLKRVTDEEYCGIGIPLPYEHIEDRDISSKSNDKENAEHTQANLDQTLNALILYTDSGLTEQCSEFKRDLAQYTEASADQFEVRYKCVQDEITKTLCKCDAITGDGLSDSTRKLRKDTVRKLERMAQEIEECYSACIRDSRPSGDESVESKL